jgi:SAM-dependent methyltransferase
VGGGDSRLVDALLLRGIRCVTVLDVAGAALARARQRLGPAGDQVRWVEADVTDAGLLLQPVDIWHDRAVFHFLTDADDRRRYVAQLRATLKPGGCAIVATFAPQGPKGCSGLQVARYSSASLKDELGDDFCVVTSNEEEHHTPSGVTQLFQWSRFVFRPAL